MHFDIGETVEKLRYPECYSSKVLSKHKTFLVLPLVIDHSGIYIHESWSESMGADASITTICRLLQKYGFNHWKSSL